ncbi:MAG: hypothetical protein AB7J13_08300 [Pyrinomonadaceae bacterium]
MIGEPDKTSEEYFNLMSGLADSAMDMSDEEIEEEIAETGNTAEETKNLFLNAIKLAKLQALREAKVEHEAAVLSLRKIKFERPETPAEKRGMIQSILAGISASQQQSLTAQFREYESLPDEDLDRLLDQLYILQQRESEGD